MRNQQSYEAVFSQKFPIEVWPVLVSIYKQVEAGLIVASPRQKGERFISNWRGLVAFILAAKRLTTFDYSVDQLLGIGQAVIEPAEIQGIWDVVRYVIKGDDYRIKIRHSLVRACCNEAASRYDITGTDRLDHLDKHLDGGGVRPVPSELLEAVDAQLPAQPWKPGIHHEIAAKLQRKPSDVNKAIQQLIADRKRFPQRDGVVYDFEGRVMELEGAQAHERKSFFSRIFRLG